jgi:hypothetical protein
MVAAGATIQVVVSHAPNMGTPGDKGGILYKFSTTTTDADPGAGYLRVNNATIASVTQLYIDNTDRHGNTVTGWLDSFDDSTNTVKGTIRMLSNSGTAIAIFNMTGSVVDGTGYRKITVVYIAGSLPANNEEIVLDFSRSGDSGEVDGAANTVLNGAGAPAGGTGTNGDFYIDTTAWEIYGPKTLGSWGSATSLRGADGTDGNTVLYGTAAPTTEGVNGDFYIRTTTNYIYGPKAGGVWPAGTSLVGPQGAAGADGADGADGAAGADGTDGNTVLYGTAAPTTEGVNGDFYIRTTTNYIYGPKAGGVWPAGTSLVGPQGAAGADGADGADGAAGADGTDGNTVLYGTAAPTTEGVNGDFYIRTTTNYIYGPKAGGVWPAGTSLVGPQGPAGADGADGADGVDGSSAAVFVDQTPDNGTYGALAGSVNGSNTVFTVSQGSYVSGSLQVFLNGQLQTQGSSNDFQETTPASGTFTFNTAPVTGDIITAIYSVAAGEIASYSVSTYTSATVNITAKAGEHLIILDSTSNNITVNIPTAVGNTAKYHFVRKVAANTITLDAAGSETINGSLTAALTVVDQVLSVVSDQTNLRII